MAPKDSDSGFEFAINPLNPLLQLVGIGIIGLVTPVIFPWWMSWLVWFMGSSIWVYFHFVYKFREGAV